MAIPLQLISLVVRDHVPNLNPQSENLDISLSMSDDPDNDVKLDVSTSQVHKMETAVF